MGETTTWRVKTMRPFVCENFAKSSPVAMAVSSSTNSGSTTASARAAAPVGVAPMPTAPKPWAAKSKASTNEPGRTPLTPPTSRYRLAKRTTSSR